ncbi:MAG TPA: thioredoxin domain-containing protein [Bryobacteraceae bacterium]|nr:thioredoxin domain-containing protein [Bryobacteraceae bacterium]
MKPYAVALVALLPCLAASVGDVDKAKCLGNAAAPVRLELYSDFECPGCKAFHETVLPAIMKDYVIPGKAYIVNHEFPLPMHAHSREAANYATAAAHIGKYQQVADALFKNQAAWVANGKVWDTVAAVLTPAEQKKVLELAKEQAVVGEVQQDVTLGQMQRVNQTPTLLISGKQGSYAFPGPDNRNYPLLKSLLDDHFLK